MKGRVGRVALLTPGFGGGGAENVFVILANYWASIGYQVDYLVLNNEGPMKKRLAGGVRTRVIDGGASRSLRRLRIAKGLSNYCISEKPDILLSTLTYCNLSATFARRLWGLGGTRLIIREANALENIRKTGILKSILTEFAMRMLYKCADTITANSEHTLEQLITEIKVPKSKCRLIRNPVPRRAINEIKNEQKSTSIIMGCGRLIPQKDFGTLIRAYNEVRQNYDCRLVILGDGPDRDSLLALASDLGIPKDHFEMPGFIEDPSTYYSQASVFVLPSKWEGLPNVVLEALSLGIPVVATDCSGGTREIFDGVEQRHLCAVGDYHSMAVKILNFLHEPPLSTNMLSLVYPMFAVETIAQSYTESLVV